MTATIAQLSRSAGGVPKHAVMSATVTPLGLAGDVQKHKKIHGGPERALCLFSLEVIERLRAEGHPIAPGTTGENITIRGLDWAAIYPGDRLALGERVLVQITELTDPCKQIRRSFVDGFFRRILAQGDSRLYARVLATGELFVGDPVRLLPAPR